MKVERTDLIGNIFWHYMNVPRKIRYEYILELNKSKQKYNDSGKHKGKMISFINDKIKYVTMEYGNRFDKLY